MKRHIALLLIAVMLCTGMGSALAAFSREDFYSQGLLALEEMTPESINLAIGDFEAAGSYEQAIYYKQYAQSLSEIIGMDSADETNIAMTRYRLREVARFPDFAASLADHGFPSCEDLQAYIDAREQERAGHYAQARRSYLQIIGVLDAMDRRIALTLEAYKEGKALYEAGDYAEAAEALEGLFWEDSEVLYQQAYAIVHPTPKPISVTKDSYITFGHYPQTAAGDDNTPIEWLVLEVDEVNHLALLISRYGLDVQPYNTKNTDVTWEKCSLRTWLNGTFLNKAFTAQEQTGILMTNVDNSSNQGYSDWSTGGGNDTQDKIFLLSYAEANKYLGVTFYSNNTRSRVAPTAFAVKQGAYTSNSYKTTDGPAARWWLRSPGYYQYSATFVGHSGSLYYGNVDNAVVRPAIWVDLNSDFFSSDP